MNHYKFNFQPLDTFVPEGVGDIKLSLFYFFPHLSCSDSNFGQWLFQSLEGGGALQPASS